MNKFILVSVSAIALTLGIESQDAHAAGCIKGAIVGGVVGHFAGHGAAGAAAGCVYNKHKEHQQVRDANRNAENARRRTN